MLPGEVQTEVITDQKAKAVVAHAAAHHHGCCAQLLLRSEGQVVGVTGLIELDRKADANSDGDGGVRLQCVGRVQLLDLRESDDGVLIARVEPYVDEEEDPMTEEEEIGAALGAAVAGDEEAADAAASRADDLMDATEAAARAVAASAEANGVSPEAVVAAAAQLLANLDAEMRTSHDKVAELRGRLGSRVDASADGEDSSRLPLELAEELRALGREGSLSLAEVVTARREVLLCGLPAGAPLHEALGELWAAADEKAAERQLLSFAAASTMSPAVRTHALLTSSTSERVTAALCALREEERRLAAVLALQSL